MKVFFYTLGCKVNQYETESFKEMLTQHGLYPTQSENEAEIFVVNSCTVTAESSRKTRQAVRKFKRNHPDGTVILTGCMPQAFPKEAEKLYEADIITGNSNPLAIPDLIKRFKDSKKRVIDIKKHVQDEKYNTPVITSFSQRSRAFMKIEDGCENFCTYCIIPYARGKVRSRSIESIKKEAEILANKGFSEIVLVGINLTSYGKDIGENLYNAVNTISEIPGISRIRLGSLEPDKMDDEILLKLSKIKKFCPHFHLSLQSGCSATLKRMNRHYDAPFYNDLVNRIRKYFKNPSITTDIMVGFPGETDEEFKENLNFAKKIKFSKSHIFMYSKRPGTIAANLPLQVEEQVKRERSKQMIKVALKSENEFLNTQLNKECDVLFENSDEKYTYGYTENYIRIAVDKDDSLRGKTLTVIPIENQGEMLFAKIK